MPIHPHGMRTCASVGASGAFIASPIVRPTPLFSIFLAMTAPVPPVTGAADKRDFPSESEIRYTLCIKLSWSHLREIMRVADPKARTYYLKTAAEDGWDVRELQRQIRMFAYERAVGSAAQSRFGLTDAETAAILAESDPLWPES